MTIVNCDDLMEAYAELTDRDPPTPALCRTMWTDGNIKNQTKGTRAPGDFLTIGMLYPGIFVKSQSVEKQVDIVRYFIRSWIIYGVRPMSASNRSQWAPWKGPKTYLGETNTVEEKTEEALAKMVELKTLSDGKTTFNTDKVWSYIFYKYYS